MKIDKLREMIGQKIQWEEHYCPKAGCGLRRSGVLLEVRGRNLLVDQMGSLDWKWVPYMRHLGLVAEQQVAE